MIASFCQAFQGNGGHHNGTLGYLPGNFQEYFQINGEILAGEFVKTLRCENGFYETDDDEQTYEMTFNYCFDFIYRNKIMGIAFVYGGFYIEYTKPSVGIYLSSHCNHYSMPMCQHFTREGKPTQFFIDRITEVLENKYDYIVKDELATSIHYLNQRKGN